MTPRDSPLLIWVGNREQPARRETEDSRSCRSEGTHKHDYFYTGGRILCHCLWAGVDVRNVVKIEREGLESNSKMKELTGRKANKYAVNSN